MSAERVLEFQILITHHIHITLFYNIGIIGIILHPQLAMAAIGSSARFVSRKAVASSLTQSASRPLFRRREVTRLIQPSSYLISCSTTTTSFFSRHQPRRTFTSTTTRTMSHNLYDSETPSEVKEAKVTILNPSPKSPQLKLSRASISSP